MVAMRVSHASSKPLPRERIEGMLTDLRYEPRWRAEASKELDIYDSKQLDAETLQKMKALGVAPIITNLVAPTIDSVIGLEARTRTDPLVRPETDEHSDAAQAMTVKLKEASRVTRANRACADAFGKQVKIGLGWVEVSRSSDAFDYPYRVIEIDRREMWHDWRARQPDLSDARWIVRQRWYDTDEAIQHFPRHKRLLRQAANQRPYWDQSMTDEDQQGLLRALDVEQSSSLHDEEWRDTDRGRLAIYEVWYRTFVTIKILRLPTGRVIEYDDANPRHRMAAATQVTPLETTRTSRIRVAYYCGPHALADMPSPYTHNRFPYVPFFGKREDRTGQPYGLIRAMRGPQEEYNARRSKFVHNLATRRVYADGDAVHDHEKAAEQVARSDAYLILNENRRNADGFRVEADEQVNAAQMAAAEESKNNVQESVGLFHEFLGRSGSGDQSGEAIKNLVEQGQQVLGEIMDNFRESRRLTHELLLSMIVEDMKGQENIPVPVESADGKKRVVILNHLDPEGGGVRTNDVMRLRAAVALDETPNSVTYRQQTLDRLMDITQALPAELQVPLVNFIIRATDLPDRKEMADQLMAMAGLGGGENEPKTEEEAEEQEQAEKQAAAREEEIADLELRDMRATVTEKEARAMERMANARAKEAATAKLMDADTRLTEAQIFEILRGVDRSDTQQGADLMEKGARLVQEQENAAREAQQPASADAS